MSITTSNTDETVTTKSSARATASFVLALVSGILGIFVIVLMCLDEADTHAERHLQSLIGLIAMLDTVMVIIGLVLGLLVLRKRISNKWMAVTGVSVNGVFIALVIIVVILGSLG